MAFTSRVIGVLQETHDTTSIRFERPLGFNYLPGHYAIFDYMMGTELVRRSYSLSSSPTESFLQISVKRIPNGKMSNYLSDIRLGETLTFNGPLGKFALDETIKNVVFVAGGSGISPFRGMAKFIHDKKLEMKAMLIYGSRSPDDIIMREFFEDLNKSDWGFRLFLTIDKPNPSWNFHVGFINADVINEATSNQPLGKVYYLCGPPVMITSVKNTLIGLSVKEEDIRLDAWG